MHNFNNHLLCRRMQIPVRYPNIQNTALRNIMDTNNKTSLAAQQIQTGLPTIKDTKLKSNTIILCEEN